MKSFYSKNVFIMIKVIPVNLIVHQYNNSFLLFSTLSQLSDQNYQKTFFLLNT